MVVQAATSTDAEEGLLFMQEMVELSKTYTPQMETMQQAVSFSNRMTNKLTVIPAGPAHFGKILRLPTDKVCSYPGNYFGNINCHLSIIIFFMVDVTDYCKTKCGSTYQRMSNYELARNSQRSYCNP